MSSNGIHCRSFQPSGGVVAIQVSSIRRHSIAVDSRGNIYTGEALEGKRLQRFLYKGMGSTSRNLQR